MRNPCGNGNVLYLDPINVDIPGVILQQSFIKYVNIEGNWVEKTQNPSVLFFV